MATRIAVMKDGIVRQFGTPDDIYQRPADTFVATFMGSPAMNLLPAVVRGGQVMVGDVALPVPASAGQVADGRAVQLGLRPEWFTPARGAGNLTLTVEVLEPTGPDIYAALRFGPTPLMARLPAGTPLVLGHQQAFDIDLDKAVLFDADSGLAIYG